MLAKAKSAFPEISCCTASPPPSPGMNSKSSLRSLNHPNSWAA